MLNGKNFYYEGEGMTLLNGQKFKCTLFLAIHGKSKNRNSVH